MGLFSEIKQAASKGLQTNQDVFEKEIIAMQHPVIRRNIFGRKTEYHSIRQAEFVGKKDLIHAERGGWLLASAGSAFKVAAICLAMPAAPTLAPLLLLPAFGLGAYFTFKQSQKTSAKLNQTEVNYNHSMQQWSNGHHPIQQAAHIYAQDLAKPLGVFDYLRGAKHVFQTKLGEIRSPVTPPALGDFKRINAPAPTNPNVYVAPEPTTLKM